jgi:hypothetical protein
MVEVLTPHPNPPRGRRTNITLAIARAGAARLCKLAGLLSKIETSWGFSVSQRDLPVRFLRVA